MLDALSPPRRRLVLGAAGLAVLVVLALLVSLAVRAVGRADPVPQDRPGPVLLVPGYGGRLASLDPLADALRADGRTVVVVTPPGDGTGDLDQQAEHLAAIASQGGFEVPVKARFPLDQVQEAYRELSGRSGLGKIVLEVSAP